MPPKKKSAMNLALRGRQARMEDNPNTDRSSLETMQAMLDDDYDTEDVRGYTEAVGELNDAAKEEVKGAELAAELAEKQLREQIAGDDVQRRRAVAPYERRSAAARAEAKAHEDEDGLHQAQVAGEHRAARREALSRLARAASQQDAAQTHQQSEEERAQAFRDLPPRERREVREFPAAPPPTRPSQAGGSLSGQRRQLPQTAPLGENETFRRTRVRIGDVHFDEAKTREDGLSQMSKEAARGGAPRRR